MRRGAQGVGWQLRRRAQLLRDLIYRVDGGRWCGGDTTRLAHACPCVEPARPVVGLASLLGGAAALVSRRKRQA